MRKKISRLLRLAALVSICANSGLRAQWTGITSPWGQGIDDKVIANDSNIFLTNVLHLYRSTNDGRNWTNISGEIYAPSSPFLAGSILFVVGGDSGYVYHSTDNGLSWDSICKGLPSRTIGVLGGTETNLFAAGGYNFQRSIFRSTDSGASWVECGKDLPIGDYLNAVAVFGNSVFVGNYFATYGIYRSKDSGVSWKSVTAGLPKNSSLSALNAIGSVLLVGLGFGGGNGAIYRSTNDGETWIQSSSGLSSFDTVMEFAVRGSKVFVALDQGGVYYSNDSGQTWIPSSWPNANPLTRSIAATNQNVFVGGYLSGFWRRPLSDFNNTNAVNSATTPNSLSLATFPSPTTTRTTISFTLPESGTATLTLTDAAGREWPLVAPSWFAAGEHEVTWDASMYPSGVYLCRLIAGEESVAKRIVVIK